MTKAKFYADLNPRYPSKGEKRWRLFISFEVKGGERLINIVEASGTSDSRLQMELKADYLSRVFDELDGIFVEVKV
jgi:hypothetical protein